MKTQRWWASYFLDERTEIRHGVFFRNKVFLLLLTEMELRRAKRSRDLCTGAPIPPAYAASVVSQSFYI
jgi:hypothetical protein